jgi:hypothetical protein
MTRHAFAIALLAALGLLTACSSEPTEAPAADPPADAAATTEGAEPAAEVAEAPAVEAADTAEEGDAAAEEGDAAAEEGDAAAEEGDAAAEEGDAATEEGDAATEEGVLADEDDPLPEPPAVFDGAWVVKTHSGKAAWRIDGDALTVREGSVEKTYAFEIVDDCSVSWSLDGSTTYTKYAWDAGTLYVGPGNAGVIRHDGTVRACISDAAYEWRPGACEKNKKTMFDKWEAEPAECDLVDGVFTGGNSTLDAVGRALLNTQMKGSKAVRYPSFDEAKAALR